MEPSRVFPRDEGITPVCQFVLLEPPEIESSAQLYSAVGILDYDESEKVAF